MGKIVMKFKLEAVSELEYEKTKWEDFLTQNELTEENYEELAKKDLIEAFKFELGLKEEEIELKEFSLVYEEGENVDVKDEERA